jgi:putative addiction module component (TIGR02574 family)
MELLRADEILRMSVTERAHLIAQLWDSLLNEEGLLPEAEKAELLRRLAGAAGEPSAGTNLARTALAETTGAGITWEQLKAELARRKAEQSDKGLRAGGAGSRSIGGIIGPY